MMVVTGVELKTMTEVPNSSQGMCNGQKVMGWGGESGRTVGVRLNEMGTSI